MAVSNTHIEIGMSTRKGAQLRNTLDTLARLRADLTALKASMDAAAVGAAVSADYAAVEAIFNVETGAQTGVNGQAVYNLVAGALVRMNAPAIDDLLARLG